MKPYEKLGAFYLGRVWDPATRATRQDLLLYDAKDLTTHAVCVGMTGSGKTGLCLSLLEEAAIDGVPAIAVDPKGDLGNLLLAFPELRGADFRPWIDESEAAREGRTADEHAERVASRWREGLAEWDQDGERVARFRDAADVAIYTPGSAAGLPLRVLRSFAVPPAALLEDADALRERVGSTASGLLTLLGIDADPVRSREHILLATLLQRAWSEGRDLDLAALVREIQSPPIDRVGVMELESFYPARERFELSMRLNNLLASPGFAAWMEGEPLSARDLLWTAEGRPRISIVSIAHLSDAERMFFVTLLLDEVLAWMRTQPGTASLRALLYMDEIFGFFPPTANPPSKIPMLTLLKQARAYGLGVVLATQNPVDLDYKGLSNTGTWFLGRLQTERDKARVLDGLEGASTAAGAGFDRSRVEATLSGLEGRVFLMNNVHEREPVLFRSRWALSYLRGPLTRAQIRTLTDRRRAAHPGAGPTARADAGPPVLAAATQAHPGAPRPVLPADVPELFLGRPPAVPPGGSLLYRPALLGVARLHYADARRGVDAWEEVRWLAPLSADGPDDVWSEAESLDAGRAVLEREGDPAAAYAELPGAATRAASYARWGKALSEVLYRERPLTVWRCAALKQSSRPGESEGAFRVRLQQAARERRDAELARLEKRYAPKLEAIRNRIRRAEERVERERSQYGQQKLQTAISVGATLLGAMFGRKVASAGSVGRATTAMRGAGRAAREKDDVARAEAELEAQRADLEQLEGEFRAEAEALQAAADPAAIALESSEVRPRKSDIAVERVALVWTPWLRWPDGRTQQP